MTKKEFLKYLNENEKAVDKAMEDFKKHSINFDKKFKRIFKFR